MFIDVLIVLIALAAVYKTWHSGFVRQFLASGGFFGGLLLGRWLTPHTISLVHAPTSRTLVTITTILGTALCCLIIGEWVGIKLKYRLIGKQLNHLDNGLGALLSIGSILISAWLVTAVANSLPPSSLSISLNQSKIISSLNRLLPSAPRVIADLGKLIDPNGFPNVFIGNEPIPRGDVKLPALGDLLSAVNADKNSVVRIEGQGCGGIVSGSGFVVGNNLVATNAHVIAGISRPVVQDVNGAHNVRVVWFDPGLDFAVLRVSGLAGKPLSLSSNNAASGTPAAVLGYPGGGAFNAGVAAVLDEFEASGHNIYDSGLTLRQVYEIQASVIPGNSGGPLVAENGSVIGVVFAESTSYNHVGYALTMSKVISEIQRARNNYQTVSTGACAG
ncbi:MAG TPA: MarP family serine protease [Candidatus Dormibacteraeota bacterium]|nr:MarP family serine protease [Candidatus Dormibacteraeota bacterium]